MADECVLQLSQKIADQLQQDASAVRVKKLIIYACKNWWETDPDILGITELEKLVSELRQLHPSLEQLQARLKTLVGTLNKRDEYFPIAHLISQKMEALYAQSGFVEVTAIVSPPGCHPQIEEIASRLQNLDLIRIKKLMLSTARNYWETDPLKIHHAQLQDLIDELWQGYPTLEELRAGFASVVKTLNKPVEYALIAEMILQEMRSLYLNQSNLPTDLLPHSAEVTAPDLLKVNPLLAINAIPADLIDLFDLRLEIIKYANPLRAKILLFSIVYYHFSFSPQDWSNLKLYTLEGLLRSLTTVCESINDLQTQLQDTAQQLSQPDEFVDVAHILLKCLKPTYPKLQQQVQQAMNGSLADTTQASATQVLLESQSTQIELA
ncbi:hypothetical protein [Phormidesmis priestleyi]